MTPRITPERAAELLALADAATAPPWTTYHSGEDWPIETGEERPGGRDYLGCSPDDGVRAGFDRPDAAFIAAARQAVPDLIADLAEARAERDAAVAKVERVEALVNSAPSVPIHAGGGNLVSSERMIRADDLRAALAGES